VISPDRIGVEQAEVFAKMLAFADVAQLVEQLIRKADRLPPKLLKSKY
jgi:hypothetical protein